MLLLDMLENRHMCMHLHTYFKTMVKKSKILSKKKSLSRKSVLSFQHTLLSPVWLLTRVANIPHLMVKYKMASQPHQVAWSPVGGDTDSQFLRWCTLSLAGERFDGLWSTPAVMDPKIPKWRYLVHTMDMGHIMFMRT